MKILHTADWHLGKRLEGIPRLEEQRAVLEEICEVADREGVDAVLVAGDLFDTFNPSSEAEELLYKTLKRLAKNGKRAVIAIAGNHDSPERIEAPDPLARECGIIFAGFPNSVVAPFSIDSGLEVLKSSPGFIELKTPNSSFPLRLILTPYANEYRLKKFLGFQDNEAALRQHLEQHWTQMATQYCDEKGINILMAHLFFAKEKHTLPPEPEEEKPILHVGGAQAVFSVNVPEGLDYVALGHLHRCQTVDENPCPMMYSGSPLSYSFAEANQKKVVVILEAEPGREMLIKKVALTKGKALLKQRFEDVDEAAKWLAEHPDAIVELTLVMNEYLSIKEKKRLLDINPNIFLIPELKGDLADTLDKGKQIDLGQSTEQLFKQYFEYRHSIPPDAALLDLFKEVLAEEPEA